MYKYLRDDIKKLESYKVNEIEYQIKVDANEGLPWINDYNRYPNDRSDKLRMKLASDLNKSPDEILIGNGSSELIELVMKAYLDAGETVMSISPTFSMYKIFTIIHKGKYEDYPLTNMEYLDTKGFIDSINHIKPKLVIISNPNNPTGTMIPYEDILEITNRLDGMMVLDEAYIDFSSVPLKDDTREVKNLIVLRTFSKAMSLAGIRLGYMIANEEVIEYINRVRSPYNVNSLTQEIALKALESKGLFLENIENIKNERERMKIELEKKGFSPLSSQGNFLFFQARKGFGRKLQEKGILIRGYSKDLEGYFRLTIGSREENNMVLKAIEEVQNERS